MKVAIRVRPFNTKEIQDQCKVGFQMMDNQTLSIALQNETALQQNNEILTTFKFDYIFWSHDGFTYCEKGQMQPTSPEYASQEYIYNQIGPEIIESVLEGINYNVILMGEFNSGKTYTMFGSTSEEGLVDLTMKDLCQCIESHKENNLSFQITVSMFEVYNERIQDLLLPAKDRNYDGLRIKEHPENGVYVEGLSKSPVNNYTMFKDMLEKGLLKQKIAITCMGSCTRWIHTFIQVDVLITNNQDGLSLCKHSVLKFVDTGDLVNYNQKKLEEAKKIQMSITNLKTIIYILSQQSEVNEKTKHIPYRDSKVTRILQNALGGSSKTLMVYTLNPSHLKYEETLMTLRLARKSMNIINIPNINIIKSDNTQIIQKSQDDERKNIEDDLKF